MNVVTSAGSAGRIGFTATAVCSVSDRPPTLIVCMNRDSTQNGALKKNGVLCVNTLADGQQELGPLFAGLTTKTSEERFLTAAWDKLATGAPVLHGALASFDCIIDQAIEVGTHTFHQHLDSPPTMRCGSLPFLFSKCVCVRLP